MVKQELPSGLIVYKKTSKTRDTECCDASVFPQGAWHSHQCSNKWKVKKCGYQWCGIHDPDKVVARNKKTKARQEAKFNQRMAPYRKAEKLEAVLEYGIAETKPNENGEYPYLTRHQVENIHKTFLKALEAEG